MSQLKIGKWLLAPKLRQQPRARVLIVLFLSIIFTSLTVSFLWGEKLRWRWRTEVMSTYEPGCVPSVLPIKKGKSVDGPIPNIVHYVWLLNGRDHLSVDFRVFISVYSASVYFKPETIYLHTDATEEQWDYAKNHGNDPTRWTLRVKNIKRHHVTPPTHTYSCVQILKIQHKSDFVRTEQLHKFGGIYMDTDVVVLKDVKPLRESGWSNIMGIEDRGKVNNGFIMSQPGSALQAIFKSEQHQVFDNRWTTHSIDLLSRLAYRLQAVHMEVLILGIKVFSPSSWRKKNIEELFNPHTETSPSEPNDGLKTGEGLPFVPTSFEDAVDYWNFGKNSTSEDWEIDYSGSYVIHAFDGENNYWPEHVTVDYIMSRQSNYARAVYPTVKHAIENNVIEWKH